MRSFRSKFDQISSPKQPASEDRSSSSRLGSLPGSSSIGAKLGNLGILSSSQDQQQAHSRGIPSDATALDNDTKEEIASQGICQPQTDPNRSSTVSVAVHPHHSNTYSPAERPAPAQLSLGSNENVAQNPETGVLAHGEACFSAPSTTAVNPTGPMPAQPPHVEAQPTQPKTERKRSGLNIFRTDKPAATGYHIEHGSSAPLASQDSITTQPVSTPKDPGFKLKIPKSLRGMSNLSELDIDFSGGDISIVSDTKKAQRKEGLCTTCSKINWEQFDAQKAAADNAADNTLATKFTHKLVFLDRILRKKRKNNCHFCCLIFDAIAENDPFEHPAVRDNLPRELVGMSFKQWAESLNVLERVPIYKTAYPFGRSRDKTVMEHKVDGDEVLVVGSDGNEELTPEDMIKTGSVAATLGVTTAMWNETDVERVKIMATVGTIIPTVTSFMTNLDSKLPVAVSIIVHNVGHADEGLLNVDVWGYGNAHRAPLSRISTFNFRVASGYQSSLEGNLRYGRLLQPEIDVENDCKLWLENCCDRHGKGCDEPNGWNKLPPPSGPHFRLIDVDAMRVVQKDMLTLGGSGKPRYSALSYVWGIAGKLCLNLHMRNLASLASGLENSSIPIAQTIRDAIDVTRRMGLQYIWVDSLCIIQHDEFGEDDPLARLSQIEQMDRIFGHAAVTIVAADGLDAAAGLTGISTKAARNQIARQIQPNVNVLLAVQYNASLGKWDTRAWTLQEKLLSKRMLVFNSGYVSFHCRHGVLREDMPALHARNGPAQIPWVSIPEKTADSLIKHDWDGKVVLLRSPFFSEYANLLAQYTSRDMTDSRDALNAVLGLLKVLERIPMSSRGPERPVSLDLERANPSSYTLQGLPEKFLDLALMWQPPAAQGVYLTKRAHDDLPSWSWTGWEVSKDPSFLADAEKTFVAKPGVRFEEPFLVATNDDLSLKKVVGREYLRRKTSSIKETSEPLEERFRPLVMWYKVQKSSPETPGILLPVNGHGMGLALGQADSNELSTFLADALRFRATATDIPPKIDASVPLDTHHLVCETQVAQFKLRSVTPRTETLWKRTEKGLMIDSELLIPEAEVLNSAGEAVGRVIPTDQRRGLASGFYDFILLSESQYWGNEVRVDVSGLPLFNVMFVEWDTRKEFATRVGVGKVLKKAWRDTRPTNRVIILN